MAQTTFSGPVGSQNGFNVPSTDPVTGTVTAGAVITRIRSASAALDFPSIAAAAQATLTINVAGAAVNDEVVMGLPAAPAAGIIFNAFVSAAGVVSIRASNITAAPVDPASATYAVFVFAVV